MHVTYPRAVLDRPNLFHREVIFTVDLHRSFFKSASHDAGDTFRDRPYLYLGGPPAPRCQLNTDSTCMLRRQPSKIVIQFGSLWKPARGGSSLDNTSPHHAKWKLGGRKEYEHGIETVIIL